MACSGCGKKLPGAQTSSARATAPATERWVSLVNREYRNTTDETLSCRIPRFELAPGETILLTSEMISYTVRMWIRSGSLQVVAVEPATAKAEPAPKTAPAAKAAPATKKAAPAAKKAVKKPAAKV